nr:recombination regulator RecX [Shouchella clausii]
MLLFTHIDYKEGRRAYVATISKITVQKKAKQRYNVFIGKPGAERFAFSVDEAILVKYGLRKGLELDENEIKALIEADELKKTHHLALHYLSYRMRTEKEIRNYLKEKDRLDEHIEKTIASLKAEKLIDDRAFAEAFARSKTAQTVIGPNKIRQQLLQKGVDAEAIAKALSPYQIKWQIDVLTAWLDKQERRAVNRRESNEQLKQKRTQQLLAKGFEYEAIQVALANREADEDNEWEALVYQGEKLLKSYVKKYNGRELTYKLKQALYRKGFALSKIDRFLQTEMEGEET